MQRWIIHNPYSSKAFSWIGEKKCKYEYTLITEWVSQLSTTDILYCMILCCGILHCRIFISISGLYFLGASNIPAVWYKHIVDAQWIWMHWWIGRLMDIVNGFSFYPRGGKKKTRVTRGLRAISSEDILKWPWRRIYCLMCS